MKKLTIFLILMFFISALFFHPDRVKVGTGVAERFIVHLYEFEEYGETAKYHFDILEDLKYELEYLEISYKSIPDTFENAGTIQGIFLVLETLAITLMDVIAMPLYLAAVIIVFIVDAIILMFKLVSFIDIFTFNI